MVIIVLTSTVVSLLSWTMFNAAQIIRFIKLFRVIDTLTRLTLNTNHRHSHFENKNIYTMKVMVTFRQKNKNQKLSPLQASVSLRGISKHFDWRINEKY